MGVSRSCLHPVSVKVRDGPWLDLHALLPAGAPAAWLQSRSEAAALRTSLQAVTAELEAERQARLLASSEVQVGGGSKRQRGEEGPQTREERETVPVPRL
jgi:hypothetical protein